MNLGQILVDGGPGVLLALAILLVACQNIAVDKSFGPDKFEAQTTLPPLRIASCFATEDQNQGAKLPFTKLVLRGDINRLQAQVGMCEREFAALSGRSANEDQELQNLAKRIAWAEQSRVRLDAHSTECGVGTLCWLHNQVAAVRTSKANDDKQLELAAKQLDDLKSRLDKKRQEYIQDGRTLLSELVSICIGLSVFGYIIGTLFSGVNHTVWMLTIQRWVLLTVGGLWGWGGLGGWEYLWLRKAANPEEMAEIALKGYMRLEEVRMGTALVLEPDSRDLVLEGLRNDVAKHGGTKSGSDNGITQIRRLRTLMEGTLTPVKHPVTYYVGRGIISQQDYDGFVTRYYRWAEAAANLIVPVLALGYALHTIGTPDSNWFQAHPIYSASLLALTLYIAAQLLYGDYKRRLRDFVEGKLDQEAQKRKDAANQRPPSNSGPTPKSGRQRLEIIADGEQAAEILKIMEQLLQGRKI